MIVVKYSMCKYVRIMVSLFVRNSVSMGENYVFMSREIDRQIVITYGAADDGTVAAQCRWWFMCQRKNCHFHHSRIQVKLISIGAHRISIKCSLIQQTEATCAIWFLVWLHRFHSILTSIAIQIVKSVCKFHAELINEYACALSDKRMLTSHFRLSPEHWAVEFRWPFEKCFVFIWMNA